MKLTSAQIKQLPANVQEKVNALKKRYNTRRVSLEIKSPGWRLYLGEGCNYTFFNNSGGTMETSMISENTVGATNDGINYGIGYAPPFPQGTWIVEFQLFLGTPYIRVYHIGLVALGGK